MQKIQSLIPSLKSSLTALLGFVVFILVLGGLYFVDNTYRIKHIKVLKDQPSATVAGYPEIEEKYLFLTSEKDIAATITHTNPSIKSVSVHKVYPDTITLDIIRYEPLVYLKSQEGFFLLSDEAVILGKSKEQENKSLPVITYYQSVPFAEYQAGEQLPLQDIRDSIFFLRKLRELGVKINSIDIAGFHMLGLYTEDKKYFFSSEKDRSIQMYDIEQAIKRFKSEKSEYKAIDVRFDKPVITF